MNLLFDCATVGFISLGIVCVLMLGEIDLSVGSMSGLASAIVGVLWVNAGWPLAGAIAVALACGVAVGLVYALLCIPASECRVSSPLSPACWRCWVCSCISSGRAAASTCPILRRWCALANCW
ncbi:hypothetical protein LN650_05735 [Klebsiella pneumoniae subsp. pneumoniae]|nr:hypothetical protein [Klebsiella pneumoniae subsp. pneumoniae]